MNQTHVQSVLKAVSWRVIATSTTMGLAYSVTGRVDVMTSIGLLDVVLKMAFYFLHERAWNKMYFQKVARFLTNSFFDIFIASNLFLRKLME